MITKDDNKFRRENVKPDGSHNVLAIWGIYYVVLEMSTQNLKHVLGKSDWIQTLDLTNRPLLLPLHQTVF
jgi:hypothetical protein